MKFPSLKSVYSKRDLLQFVAVLLLLGLPFLYREEGLNKYCSCLLYGSTVAFLLTAIRRKWLFALVSGLFALLSFTECFLVVLYGSYIKSGNILSALNTNAQEGTGFLASALYAVPYALPVLLLWGVALWTHRSKKNVATPLKGACLTSLASSLLVVYMTFIKWGGAVSVKFYVVQNVLEVPPYNFFYQCGNVFHQLRVRRYIEEAEHFTFRAHRDSVTDTKEIYVLFIGESLRYDNLQIAGYERPTTPLMAAEENLVLCTNYYAAATLTMYSVPQIMTRATPETFDISYKEKGIVEAFKECGFKTYVICCSNLLNEGNYLYLSSDADSLIKVQHDYEIPVRLEALANQSDKSFFVLQGLGNHGPYGNSRPEDKVFRGDDVTDRYDNTVRYTDYVVTQVFRAIDRVDTQSAFLMVSDHGDDITPGRLSGHGCNCNPTPSEYHVPLIFWSNETWASNHRAKLDALRSHVDAPVNSDNVFYSLCDMADILIDSTLAKPEYSVFNPNLQLHERTLYLPDGHIKKVLR